MELEYLNWTIHKLKSNDYTDLNIVLGNESCDLDSAVSAIAYATFLYWKYNQIKCGVCTRDKRDVATYIDDIFVPILNVNRKDFVLKTEVSFCFKECGFEESNLLFRDDLDLEEIVTKSKTNVILVDHHILSKRDSFLLPYVTEIIDHRPLDTSQWMAKADIKSTIETVGSCSTLVTQRIRDLSKLFGNENDFFKVYSMCGELLHCAIILDTVNFSKAVDKATPVDKDMALFIEKCLSQSDCEDYRIDKLKRLLEARTDVSKLNPEQLLRKDTKVVGDIYIPSFPILVKDFLSDPTALDAVTAVLLDNKCSVALLLGMTLKGTLQRDAAVYSLTESQTEMMATHLQKWSNPDLQLCQQTVSDVSRCLYFKQLNLSASRKQYISVINSFLANSSAQEKHVPN